MKRFTVTWRPNAEARLATLWHDNPALRAEITKASDEVDRLLAVEPENLGIASSTTSRILSIPPLKVLFAVSVDDRTVRVIYVKFWDE